MKHLLQYIDSHTNTLAKFHVVHKQMSIIIFESLSITFNASVIVSFDTGLLIVVTDIHLATHTEFMQFLNQARAWFLKIDPVQIVCMCVCVCLCVHPRGY